MRAAIVSKLGSNVSEEAIGLRLALVILGRDTLLGTLGEISIVSFPPIRGAD